MSSVSTNAATNVGATTAQLNGSYSGSGGYLYFQWGYSSGNLAYSTGYYSGNGVGGYWYWSLTGLTPGATIYFRATGFSYGYGAILSFTTAGAPGITLEPVIDITTTSAQVSGYVNPNGSYTLYQFQAGLSPGNYTFGDPQGNVGSGTGNVAVWGNLTGLVPGTVYYYQLVASNAYGNPSVQGSFTTLPLAPSATTGVATSITETSATLTGTVSDNGLASLGGPATNCDFNVTSVGPVGATSTPFTGTVNEQGNVSGLTPGTAYSFQIAAWNADGTTYGAWVGFTTLPAPPTPSATTNAATLVTPTSAQLNASVNDNGYGAGGYGSTNCQFYFSTSMSGGTVVGASPGAFSGSINELGVVTGLPSSTTFYYYVWVGNPAGSYAGSWQSFTTLAPVEPPLCTLDGPPNGASADLTGTPTFTWTYQAQGSTTGGQTGWCFRLQQVGAPFPTYWNASTNTWSASLVWNAGTGAGYQFPMGTFLGKVSIQWSVALEDAGGQGSFPTSWLIPFPGAPVPALTQVLPGTGHIKMSPAYVNELLNSSTLHVVSRAEVWLGGTLRATFQMDPASSGHTVDRQQASRTTASIALTEGVAWAPDGANVPVVPSTPQDIFTPFGSEVVIYTGLIFPGGADEIYDPSTGLYSNGELIQVGVFGLDANGIDDTPENLVAVLTLYDRAKAVTRAGFIADTTLPPSMEIGQAIQNICLVGGVEANGPLPTGFTFQFNFQDSGCLTPSTATVYKAGDDPFAQFIKLAQSCGFAIYFDASGTLCFLPVPNPQGAIPAWSYNEGQQCLMTELQRTISRDNAPNYIIRSSSGASADPPVQAVWIDTDPTSPTWIGGSYGRQVDSASSDLITTQEQCQAAANSAGLVALGTIDAVDIKAIPRPDTAVDDVVAVTRVRSGITVQALYVIDAHTLNYGKDAQLEITQARAVSSALAQP